MNPDNLKMCLKEGQLLKNEPMCRHTTFRTGGPARYFAVPKNEQEAADLIRYLSRNQIPYTVIGNGSNLLVSDKGYDGVILHIGRNDGTDFVLAGMEEYADEEGEKVLFDAGAGCLLSALGRLALDFSCTGFEPLSGIPGCLGGALRMNAGAYGAEIGSLITAVRGIDRDGNPVRRENEELSFRYRGSSLEDEGIVVTRAEYVLPKGIPGEIREKMDEYTQRRKDKQPLEYPSAGSTFRRPTGYFAGKLIEDAGLKGFRIGGACVSPKHAGFIVNDQNGTSQDIYRLIRHVQDTVLEKTGVVLEPEVKMLGEFTNE